MLYVAIVPEPPRRVIVPTGWKSSVTQRTLPSVRLTSLTWTERRLKPPQPLNCVSSALASPLGVLPLNEGPLSGSFSTRPVCQPGGEGGGGSVTVSENVPVAVAPAASVTVTLKVEVPFTPGAPRRRPDWRSVNPAGTCPDHVYGAVPPLALKVVVKKLLTNTFCPAPTSQTPFAHVKNCVLIASGGFWPVPVPVSGTVCGLLAALSVRVNVAERVPDAVGEKVIETLQLVPAASVRPEQPSLTWVKSSGFAPRVAALLMNSGALPVLVTVIDCGALVVPIACAANVSDVGVNVTAGAAAVVVVPPPPPPPLPWSAAAAPASARAASAANARNVMRTRRVAVISSPPRSA